MNSLEWIVFSPSEHTLPLISWIPYSLTPSSFIHQWKGLRKPGETICENATITKVIWSVSVSITNWMANFMLVIHENESHISILAFNQFVKSLLRLFTLCMDRPKTEKQFHGIPAVTPAIGMRNWCGKKDLANDTYLDGETILFAHL